MLCHTCQKEIPEPRHFNRIYCCNLCRNQALRKRIEPERKRQWGRDSYHRRKSDQDKIIYWLLRNARSRALQKGYEFSITEVDITLPTNCPILGVPLSKDGRRYGYSLDKIDPSKGYIPGNVWVISQLANAMKWDSTKEERLAFANWVQSGEKGI